MKVVCFVADLRYLDQCRLFELAPCLVFNLIRSLSLPPVKSSLLVSLVSLL